MVPKEIFVAIVKNNDAEDAYEELVVVEAIVQEMQDLERLAGDESKRHDQAMGLINQRKREIRKDCPHPHESYHGSPNTGDSFYQCSICGKTR